MLFLVSWLTGRDDGNRAFFVGNRKSPWFLVAFGMVGASLSGITFISVPGAVGAGQFGYMQMCFGYLLGYTIIALVLMPLYYRLELTSIYQYLRDRFGNWSYRTGATFFMISRVIGAALRLYLMALVLHNFIFASWGVPFAVTVALTIALIWMYTFKGGIKTIVWTDGLQTFFMLLSVGLVIYFIAGEMNWSIPEMFTAVRDSKYSQMFFYEGNKHWAWQFINGAAISVVMTGLDQDMMQKNLSCRNIGDAQKNMFSMVVVLVAVNFFILVLGALLFLYANAKGISIPEEVVAGVTKSRPDLLFPEITINHAKPFIGIIFLLGLLAAAYSSADSALTSLTTSFCVDFLGFEEGKGSPKARYTVHLGFSVLLFVVILLFRLINNDSLIWEVFKAATYTYGPLLGLFAVGLFTKFKIKDGFWIPIVCVLSPILCFLINKYSVNIFNGYQIGFELLLINGLLTALGLFLFVDRRASN